MAKIKPIYKKLLIVAVVVYLIGNCIILAGLCRDVGKIKHYLIHKVRNH